MTPARIASILLALALFVGAFAPFSRPDILNPGGPPDPLLESIEPSLRGAVNVILGKTRQFELEGQVPRLGELEGFVAEKAEVRPREGDLCP